MAVFPHSGHRRFIRFGETCTQFFQGRVTLPSTHTYSPNSAAPSPQSASYQSPPHSGPSIQLICVADLLDASALLASRMLDSCLTACMSRGGRRSNAGSIKGQETARYLCSNCVQRFLILNSSGVRSRIVRVVGEEGFDCLLNADIIHGFEILQFFVFRCFLISLCE